MPSIPSSVTTHAKRSEPLAGTLRDIIALGRFPFLLAGAILFLLGAAAGALHAGWPPAGQLVLGYAVFGCAHLALSYSNEYYDRFSDCPEESPVSGGSGVLQRKTHLAPAALACAVLLTAASLLLLILYSGHYGWSPLLWAWVVAGNVIGWAYSAPPVRLAARGLGEGATAAAFGILMPGMGYLITTGTLDAAFLPFALPLTSLGVVFILAVELPDCECDRAHGKKTAVVRLGRRRSATLILAAAGTATLLFVLATTPSAGILPAVSSLPVLGVAAVGWRECDGSRTAGRRAAVRTVAALVLCITIVTAVLIWSYLTGNGIP